MFSGYTVHFTEVVPPLDAAWENLLWQQAEEASIRHFHPASSSHRPIARARVLCDRRSLYVQFHVEDRRLMHQHLQIACAVLIVIAEATALHGAEAGQRPPAPPNRIELRSASLAFALDANSLGAVRWRNQIARTKLDLSGGCELEVEVGDKPQQARKVLFQPAGVAQSSPKSDRAVVQFQSSDHVLAATLVYQIDPQFPVLRKFVELVNTGQHPLRVLNVVLGRYPVQAKAEGGERGFPLYLGDEYF